MKKHRYYIFFTILLFANALTALYANGNSEAVPLDPAVHRGILENGMTYYVRENNFPADRAYLRLVVNAGSVLEDEDQLGMAHLLEHMAFNGTRSFHENDLVRFLQGIGMQFGPDINAHTSFDETVYKLMIPLDDPQNLETGFQILEEWAFHMSLNDKDIEDERGIILEERRTGLGASRRMMDKAYSDIMYESLYAERLPIGTEDSIKNSTPEAIRRFYKDWYRPELMSIVAVGDFDTHEVIQTIKKRFSSYNNPAIPRERKEAAVPSHNETIYSLQSDKETSWTAAIIFNKFPKRQIRSEEDYRNEIATELYIRMFNNRLSELLDQTNPPYTYAYADFSSLTRKKSFHTMTVLSAEDDFYTAYKALLTEEKKLKDHGFSQSELELALKELTAEFKSIYKNRNNLESVEIAEYYVRHFLDREPAPGIEYQWEKFNEYASGISSEEILKLTDQWLTDENRVVYTMTPEKEEVKAIDPVELSKIHFEVSRIQTTPPAEKEIALQLMQTLPTPGKIKSKSYFEGPDIHEWTLNNGARVVLKETDFKDNEILFSAMAPGGVSQAEDSDYISASFAAQAIIQSGAGGYEKREIEKILAGSTAGVKPVISELTSGFRGSSTREDLKDLFQLTYLYFTDPGKNPVLWHSYETRVKNNLANRDSSPMTQYSDLITKRLYQNHYRSRPLTTSRMDEFQLDRAFDFYKDCFDNVAGYTFFFAGSISPEELEEYIRAYLAALPAGEENQNWVDRGIRYPGGVIRDSIKSGIDPLSYVSMIYTGEWEWSDRETEIFQAVTDSLDIILTEKIRERDSGTYSPGIGAFPSKIPYEDYNFIISFSCDPERTEELIGSVKKILEDLRTETAEKRICDDVAKARKIYQDGQLQKNSFWLSRMERNYLLDMPREMIIPQDYLSDFYTAEILQDRINKYFNPDNYLEIILYPAEPAE
ncbi:MAG: hypothetical protein B6241_00190 [Spirochaetaceae bacterium 4572_59]|nr:MAG: hypothetical protein B6241_00190 [Spirochaetaceae bacterium 4572_59]